jgi:outer membrane protein assembly factor BamB
MKRSIFILLIGGLLGTGMPSNADPTSQTISSYHGHPNRSGNFVVPSSTWDRARSLHLDEGFHPQIAGHVYAQPLYWHARGSNGAILVVATEDNVAQAIDAATGAEVWRRSLGKPAPRSSLPCGDIDPLGITGTPIIDETTEAIYLDAAVDAPSGLRHLVFALSLKDGSVLPGWPVDVGEALKAEGQEFSRHEPGLSGCTD